MKARKIKEPNHGECSKAILMTTGPVVTYRLFKQTYRRGQFETIMHKDYDRLIETLINNGDGNIVEGNVNGASAQSRIFVKKPYKLLYL